MTRKNEKQISNEGHPERSGTFVRVRESVKTRSRLGWASFSVILLHPRKKFEEISRRVAVMASIGQEREKYGGKPVEQIVFTRPAEFC